MVLLIFLPFLTAIFFALLEFSLLCSVSHSIRSASYRACRVGTLPASDASVLDAAVRATVAEVLHSRRLVSSHRLIFRPGIHAGDPVVVEISVPATAASPDLLAAFGFSLQDRYLVARSVMRKE